MQPATTPILRAVAVTLFLFAFYCLTFSGAFHSIDEEAVFAVARNLVLEGAPHQNTLYRAVPYIDQAKVGLDGAFYSKYGIGHALALTPALWLARAIPGAALAPAAMLLNALATAATGGLLLLTARRLGYSERAGVLLALLYGLATFAWVYAKTMFSEPLVAFLWLAALYVLLRRLTPRRAFLSGVCLALALSIRPASVLVTPLFVLLLIERDWRATAARLVAWALPLGVVGLGLLAFNAARFGSPFDFGYSEAFDGNLLVGLQGFLFSPDRSLLLFAPPLLMLIPALSPFMHRHRHVGLTLLAVSLASLLMYSAWAVFWGGPVWGPRYLLPVLPLLFVLLLPAMERAVGESPARGWQIAVCVLALAGLAIQMPGVLWNSLPMTQTLGQRYPLWTLPPRAEWLDLAWSSAPEGLLLAGLMLLLALFAFWRPSFARVGAATVAVAITAMLLLGYTAENSFGFQWGAEEQTVLSALEERARPRDAFLLNLAPYQSPLPRLLALMNRPHLPATLYGILRDPAADTRAELDHVLSRHERLWLLTEGVTPGDPGSVTEQQLTDLAAPVTTEWLTDSLRLTLFERARPPLSEGDSAIVLGDVVTLERWTFAPSAETVQITLRWRPERADPRELHTFVQLLDSNGQLITGWDNVPRFGFMPASLWQPAQPFEERLTLQLPADGAPLSDVRLVVGMVDAATGTRLLTATGDDTITLWSGALPITPAP